MDRPGGLTDADRAWRDAFTAWVVSDAAPERLRSAATDTATADSRPELEELFRAPDGTFELFAVNLNVADAGDEAKAVVELLREHLADDRPRRPGDPRHRRRGHQLRLPRGGPGRHGQHDAGDDHPRHPRAAGHLPGAARRPHPAGHHRRRVRRLQGRARLPGGRRLAGLLHPGDLPRGHGVRGRDRLRDLPDQPLPRRGVARRRLARRRQGHGQAHRRGHHRVRRHGDRGHDGHGRRRLQDDHVHGPGHRHRRGRDARCGADPVARPPVDLRPLPVLAAPHPGEARGRAARLLRRPREGGLPAARDRHRRPHRRAARAGPLPAAGQLQLRRPRGPAQGGRLPDRLRADRRPPGRGQARPVHRAHRPRR